MHVELYALRDWSLLYYYYGKIMFSARNDDSMFINIQLTRTRTHKHTRYIWCVCPWRVLALNNYRQDANEVENLGSELK